MDTGPLGRMGRGNKVGELCSLQRNSSHAWFRIIEEANKEEVTVGICY